MTDSKELKNMTGEVVHLHKMSKEDKEAFVAEVYQNVIELKNEYAGIKEWHIERSKVVDAYNSRMLLIELDLMPLAVEQGSRSPGKIGMGYTRMINDNLFDKHAIVTAGIKYDAAKLRNILSEEQLESLAEIEKCC